MSSCEIQTTPLLSISTATRIIANQAISPYKTLPFKQITHTLSTLELMVTTANPETMDGVTIRHIDIMDHHEPQMWYQGCIAINPGDENLIQNVYIEGIRVKNFRLGQLVNLTVDYNTMYNTSPGRGIKNVIIKDLVYNGTNAWPSLVLGYDEERTITNVTFVNLVVNGKAINSGMPEPN
jgi:hypothetical protein